MVAGMVGRKVCYFHAKQSLCSLLAFPACAGKMASGVGVDLVQANHTREAIGLATGEYGTKENEFVDCAFVLCRPG
jgi:hypothetical protein